MEKTGLAIHMYLCNTSMDKKAFINNDGDMLIVPQLGRLDIQTELGHLMVAPGEICVIQRGLRFKVKLPDGKSRTSLVSEALLADFLAAIGPSRGYIQEIFGAHYKVSFTCWQTPSRFSLTHRFHWSAASRTRTIRSEWTRK